MSKNLDIYLFDSVKKEKVLFEPQEKGKVTIYVCGPTVYDDAHLGHARSAIAFDILHRVFKVNGYEVTMAKNFTDIDDKIIKKMEQTDKSLDEITTFYINSYKKDMGKLHILPNTYEPYATKNIDAMQTMCQKLLENEKAYILEDGVYLDTSKDKQYGKLSHRASDENSQARVISNNNKKDQKDFALWKFFPKEQVGYETTFGYGRPGWHLECSAMIDKHLANHHFPYAIDIHGGGADLLFPHHENEASQTRCSTSQELSKYWIHNGFVNIDGEKMSKSLGNSFFLKDALKNYDGEVIRFYMLNTHYKSDLSFNEEDLLTSKKRLDKLYRVKKRVYGTASSTPNKKIKQQLLASLNDDMNTAKAIAILDEYISTINDVLDNNPKEKTLKKEFLATIDFISSLLGIGMQDSFKYFQFGITEDEKKDIEQLIDERTEAKQNKDFKQSDKIREKLTTMGISLMDTPVGTMWEKN